MIALVAFAAFQVRNMETPGPEVCAVPTRSITVTQRVDPAIPANTPVPTGDTVVRVTVAPDGSVMGVDVQKSSGSPSLDEAVAAAAKASTYSPRLENCLPVMGAFLYAWHFGAQTAASAGGKNCDHDGSIASSARAVLPSDVHIAQPVTALVKVTIGTSGQLMDAAIQQSSGIISVDQAALDAAKRSTYTPKFVSCKAVVASYIYKLVFSPH
jgi:TonB family protein